MKVEYIVKKETYKCVAIECGSNWTKDHKYVWLPKSACKFKEYVVYESNKNGKRGKTLSKEKVVVEIADWILYKIK